MIVEECIRWGLVVLYGILFNGATLWFVKSRHFLDKRCGIQAKC